MGKRIQIRTVVYAEALQEMIVGRGKGAPVPVEHPRSGSDVHGLHRKADMEVRHIGQHCDRVPRYVMALGLFIYM